jgi:hypothetical protein
MWVDLGVSLIVQSGRLESIRGEAIRMNGSIERFLIGLATAVAAAFILTNPFHWSWWLRLIGVGVVMVVVLLVSLWHHRTNQKQNQTRVARPWIRLIVDGVVALYYLALLGLAIWLLVKSFVSKPPPIAFHPSQPLQVGPPIMEPSGITPAYLCGLYHSRTTAEGDRLVGPYMADPGRTYVVYLPKGGTARVKVERGKYGASWFNPRSGDRGELPAANGPEWVSPPAPDGDDWVLLLHR